MPLGLVDGGLVLTFGALVASDGLARVPGRAVVLSRTVGGAWRAEAPAVEPSFRLVSPLAPLRVGVVVPWGSADATPERDFAQRLDRIRPFLWWLALLGGAQLAAFVVGVPVAVGYFGGTGLLTSVALVTVLGIVVAVVARGAMRALGPGLGDGLGARLVRGLSPFSAAAAANDVLQAATRGVSAAAVAEALLSADAFARWVRPFAWDDAHGAPDPVLEVALGRKALARLLADEPLQRDAMAQAYCPRCAREFVATSLACVPCGELAVRPFRTRQD